MIERVVVGFGGNVGSHAEVIERFRRAREGIAAAGAVRSAPIYLTAPFGPPQAWFLNSAVLVEIDGISPSAFLASLLALELRLGRDRHGHPRWGPRAIDLDLLVWGDRTIDLPGLEVPHPGLVGRRFALAPLAVVLGDDAVVPGHGIVRDLLRSVEHQQLEPLLQTW